MSHSVAEPEAAAVNPEAHAWRAGSTSETQPFIFQGNLVIQDSVFYLLAPTSISPKP